MDSFAALFASIEDIDLDVSQMPEIAEQVSLDAPWLVDQERAGDPLARGGMCIIS
uniref:Putative pheromone n=1 Tax=Flammulina velutipes TaxID=38945 RepID=F1CZK7_FLAVE|nr:putative pheromone precursor [Flammulina velutipes]